MQDDPARAPSNTEFTASDACDVIPYKAKAPEEASKAKGKLKLKAPTLQQLLKITFSDRQHLLSPWLREHENCMVYAGTGVGKSLFALSVAIAVAGDGEFLGWKPDKRANGDAWKVLYIDGEMHVGDIQERARMLLGAVPGVNKAQAMANLRFIARQHQDAVEFPLITEAAGMQFVRDCVRANKIDLVILDNFSTLGDVEDENAASSFNDIQQFLLQMKNAPVATMLIHHAGKSEETFRGSSKLAATFETIIRLERIGRTTEHGAAAFYVRWDKVRAGGPGRMVREAAAKLVHEEPTFDKPARATWEFETAEMERLYEIAALLKEGAFRTQAEIATHFGVSPTMAGKYIEKGIQLGMWSKETVGRWLHHGKTRRERGETSAPVGPDVVEFAGELSASSPYRG